MLAPSGDSLLLEMDSTGEGCLARVRVEYQQQKLGQRRDVEDDGSSF